MHVATPQTARDFQPVATAASGSTMRAGRERGLDTEFHIMREARASMRTRTLVLTKWQRRRCCGICSFMASKDTQLSCPTVRSKCSHRISAICVPLQGTNAVPNSLRRLLELQIEGGPVVRVQIRVGSCHVGDAVQSDLAPRGNRQGSSRSPTAALPGQTAPARGEPVVTAPIRICAEQPVRADHGLHALKARTGATICCASNENSNRKEGQGGNRPSRWIRRCVRARFPFQDDHRDVPSHQG